MGRVIAQSGYDGRCYRYYQVGLIATVCILFHTPLYGQSPSAVLPPTEATEPHPMHPWLLCPVDELAALITVPAATADTASEADRFDLPIEADAEIVESTPEAVLLEGAVNVRRGDQQVRGASRVRLDRVRQIIQAYGHIEYGNPDVAVRSREIEVELEQEVSVFQDADYYIPSRGAQGRADKITLKRQRQESLLDDVTYSTCIRGSELWQLRARNLRLDFKTKRATARHIQLAFKNQPILYFPYLSFPITDERQSGFLIPNIGYTSDNGLDIRLPYYWNIAPNHDLTLTPRVISRRGMQLAAEYRFLRERDKGVLEVEYLPHDRQYGDDRSAQRLRYQAQPLPSIYADLLYQRISDDDYIDDLSPALNLVTPSYLERRLDVYHTGQGWLGLARLQEYQSINRRVFTEPADRPYSRLPQFRADGRWFIAPFEATLNSEIVYFAHDETVEGWRMDVWPSLSWPMRWAAGFITPKLGYRYTAYDLHNIDVMETPRRPDRSVPLFSIDSGLFLERNVTFSWFSNINQQTLEPRLFYLYVPYRDQNALPIFDSAALDRSYPWLFAENRFTGADRLGDAHQLTAALTTRLLHTATGQESLRASLGQIIYFRDQRVTLNEIATENNRTSELLAEALFTVAPVTVRTALQFTAGLDEIERAAVDIRYRSDNGWLANMSYRFADSSVDQTKINHIDAALVWPINQHWKTVARWNYSLEEARNLDSFAGFEYRDCCWAWRMLARQRRSDLTRDPENAILFELELTGLAGIGTHIDSLLESAILDYQSSK